MVMVPAEWFQRDKVYPFPHTASLKQTTLRAVGKHTESLYKRKYIYWGQKVENIVENGEIASLAQFLLM